MSDLVEHWDAVYRRHDAHSWDQTRPTIALGLLDAVGLPAHAAAIDVGGGDGALAAALLDRGHTDITVLDISAEALAAGRARLGEASDAVRWLVADIRRWQPERSFDLWHDRAVFHFLTRAEDRAAYVRQVAHAVRPGGHVIVATFGPEGPEKCSGLDVMRYDADGLHGEFGPKFRLLDSVTELHETPWGTPQQFMYCFCRVE